MQKRKLYTGINLIGLTVAIVSFLAICLYIQHEWSYDKMYSGYERIYKFNQEFVSEGESQLVSSTPSSLIPTLIDEIPDVETGTLLFDLSIFSSVLIDAGEGNQEEESFAYADENFFKVFDFDLLSGNPSQVLSEPNLLVLTRSTADRYFGDAGSAVGKVLKVEGMDFTVSGVMEDFPSNSHMVFDFLASFKSHRHGKNPEWSPSNYYTYVKLKSGTNVVDFQDKVEKIKEKYLGKELAQYGYRTFFHLQPVSDIHLGDQSLGSIKPGTDIRYLYIFGIVALLLIAIGIINYVNLATAEATERNKEVGLRKAMGAGRGQLFGQFVSESTLLTFAASVLSVLLLYLILPKFSAISGVSLSADSLINLGGLGFIIGLILIVGLLAGMYPALILSGMEPIKALANKTKMGGGAWVRKSLVVFQFFVSIGLLIATFIVKNQLDHMQNVSLGYDREQVITLPYHYSMRNAVETMKAEMLKSGAASSIALAGDIPVHIKAGYRIFPGGDNQREFMITGYSTDEDIVKTLNLTILAGTDLNDNDFSREEANDKEDLVPIILNESAIREMGWNAEEAIGKTVNFGHSDARIKAVVGDFYFNSLHENIGPLGIFKDQGNANVLLVKIPPGNPAATLATLEEVWKKLVPERPFNYKFIDQEYAQLYRSEERVGVIFTLFSGIAVLIACMGLFGLVSYVALRRTREISIRKVHGATQKDVISVLASDFFKLLLVASVLAIGFGLWFSDTWLQSFANRVSFSPWPYILSILPVLLLAGLTIGYRSWKVFRLNPAKTLKTD
ncbi:putative ABC transport system permease protein [Algoriphagus sp. 4150]|uniref:FtsX-like permease family protein n=1 Tax=Algoriphagus sp. 4150 TaxID=2817756 RepID=UPI00285DC085|nr:FtsX-like permease family protein [Algoriphagus sp. 4150]MDR7129983.1 putative ABC transport system permease protein [Algoriphagus sp. 4150]